MNVCFLGTLPQGVQFNCQLVGQRSLVSQSQLQSVDFGAQPVTDAVRFYNLLIRRPGVFVFNFSEQPGNFTFDIFKILDGSLEASIVLFECGGHRLLSTNRINDELIEVINLLLKCNLNFLSFFQLCLFDSQHLSRFGQQLSNTIEL